MKYFLFYMIFVNLFTFVLFWIDKYKAIYKKRRISEKTLLFWSLIGGFFGALLWMIFFSHKSKKVSFQVKFYLIVFVWIIVIFILIASYNL